MRGWFVVFFHVHFQTGIFLNRFLGGGGEKASLMVCLVNILFQTENSDSYSAQCVVCKVYFSAQPNKLRPILKFEKYHPVEHIFVPACSSARKIHFFKF